MSGAAGGTGGGAAGAGGAAGGAGSGGAAGGASAGAAAGGTHPGAGGAAPTPGGPAGAPGGSGPGAGGANTGVTPDWIGTFNDDGKGFVQNKGWKAPTDMLESYRNLEKLVGAPQEKLLKLPADDDVTGWESVHTRLGKPATPEAYGLKPSKQGESADFSNWAAQEFHKSNLTTKQAQQLSEGWNQYQQAREAEGKSTYQAKGVAEMTALKKEWGAAHDQNMSIAQRAAREFGIEAQVIDTLESSIGYAKTMKLFQNIGSKLGESQFVAGNPGNGSQNGPMTPAQAKTEIATLRGDPGFVKKYQDGDHVARAKMEALHKYAYPET